MVDWFLANWKLILAVWIIMALFGWTIVRGGDRRRLMSGDFLPKDDEQ